MPEALSWIARSPRRGFLCVVLLSASLRFALLPLLPLDPGWQLRQENGSTAACLIRTGEYANPYILPTGPTAHPIPFYTAVMAVAYRVHGVTREAELARCCLAAVSFSFLYALLPWLAARFGLGAPAGVIGGLMGALTPLHLPMGIFYGGLGEEFAGLALALLLAASLARWTSGECTILGAFLAGLGWGAAFHISPALLPVMLAFAVFELYWIRTRAAWRCTAVLLLGAVLACVPWTLRNYAVFGELFFIRDNFGLELRMGNHEGAALHPRIQPQEAGKVRLIGEVEYMRRARTDAIQWIRENPGTFVLSTGLRVVSFWFGPLHTPAQAAGLSLLTVLALLGAWRVLPLLNNPQRAALLLPLATFPLVYYFVNFMPRYRVPLDWILLLFAGAAVSRRIRGGPRAHQNQRPLQALRL